MGADMSVTGLSPRRAIGRRLITGLVLAALLGVFCLVDVGSAAAAGPCGPPVTSVIACENTKAGDPSADWQVNGVGDAAIQGFATQMSVQPGQAISFKINSTNVTKYHIDILRIGYYQGMGATKVTSGIQPSVTLPQSQPACKNDTAPTGLIDCGNWAVSASWSVPSTAVSGLYIAHLKRDDTTSGNGSLIPFVVRNDSSHSDILFQTDDETWQAYNTQGGNSLYTCSSNCPAGSPDVYKGASKVSYNRPWHTPLDDSGRSWFTYAEYNMIRFLEQNGYDVSYTSGLDMGQQGAASVIEQHKVFLTAGHDEYWTGPQRANVTAARDAGVNMAFFTGNEVFWKTRWEPSIDGSNTPNRTLVTYKESHYNASVDPQDPPTWTGTWADPRFSPPGDGGQPQNALTGQLFDVNSGTTDIQVPSSYSKLRFWRGTRVAGLTSGQSTTLDQGVGTLGYEWDIDSDNGFRPPGLMDMSSTTSNSAEICVDYGCNTQPNSTATHHLTLYRAASGALVFGAGTVQWSWGLDGGGTGNTDSAMQQATVNLLADMGNVQPATLIAGLTPATQTTDTTAPTSTITSPAQGASLSNGSAVTISGTATDAGGVVAGVEVSTDGGSTWHPVTTMSAANTSVTWSYNWVAHGSPTATIKVRATDDSGNLETPGPGTTVNMSCPCSIWGPAVTPRTIDSGDTASINVGVKFQADTFGYVTGIRFYKASANTGTHVGSLWTSTGQLLASATFTGETASGWQQVNFSQPVQINKNTTYVASYLAPKGHYSQDGSYFYTTPPLGTNPVITNVDSPPLHALRNTNGVVNGVFTYSGSSAFPTSSTSAANYYVDPVFTAQSFTTPPGQVGNVSATAGFASATVTWSAPTTGDQATAYMITPYIGTTYTFTVTASNPVGSGPESAQSNAVTPSASALHVDNGGFENGLTGWTTAGVALPTTSTTQFHSGSASALVGTVQPATQPLGDSNLTQTVTIPPTGTTTLSFWYRPSTADDLCSGSGCVYDWQEAQVRTTAGATLASIFKSDSNSQTWTQVNFDMTPYAGQSVVLWFNVHQDGASPPDDTWMYLDDVSLTQPSQAGAPGAPTGVTATAGNGSATVSWTAPSSNGGSAITKYTVTPFIGSTAQTPVTVTGSPPATTVPVPGLTNGTSYTFTVTASNANGSGPASSPSSAVTPSTVPGAPTGVTATAGNGSANVSWTAPGNGGSTITKYTVTPFIGSTAQTPVTVTGNPPATTVPVPGLTNGTSYTFTVTATNANGNGPASASSNAVTPTAPTVPGAPTAVTATAGNTAAVVTWNAPGNGGSPITSYTVTPFIGAQAQTQAAVTVTGNPPATSATVTQLTNGTSYTFTVTATNANGTGPDSAASNAVTPSAPTVPGPPTTVSATAGNGSATVSWAAPSSDGGSPVTSYTVTPFIGAQAQTPKTVTGTPPATSTTVTGLTNGTSYTFTVSAVNAVGTGQASAPSNAVTPTAAGPITVDKTIFTDGSGTMTSPSLTTTTANDLVVAFVAGDGPPGAGNQTYTVSGAGLTWTLAKRNNTQSGDSEVWWARASGIVSAKTVQAAPAAAGFHGSLTVVAFANAGGIGATAAAGAATGAPDLTLANTGVGSWVYAVGNDWDSAVAHTPASGQVIVHQRVDTAVGDTFWVQSTTAPNTAAGTVHIHDNAPTGDQWNYAGIEVLPATN
jgi:hypothetical protein